MADLASDVRPAIMAGRDPDEPAQAGSAVPRRSSTSSSSSSSSSLAIATDWGRIGEAFFNPDALDCDHRAGYPGPRSTRSSTPPRPSRSVWPRHVLALMKLSAVRVYRVIATGYIEFFRGIPALLVVFAFGYGIPAAFEFRFDSDHPQIALALGIVSAAYIAETTARGHPGRAQGAGGGGALARHVAQTDHAACRRAPGFPHRPPPADQRGGPASEGHLPGLRARADSRHLRAHPLGQRARSVRRTAGLTSILVVGLVYLVITIPLSSLTRWLERKTGYRGHV